MRALVICDEAEEREFLVHTLRHVGLSVLASADLPQDTAAVLEPRPYDIFLIAADNAEKAVRQAAALRTVASAPLIILVDTLSVGQHCALLDAGADLVLAQPTSPRILKRYVRILLRRTETAVTPSPVLIEVENVVLDPGNHTVSVNGGEPQTLTQLEFRLLHVLMTHPEQVISLDEIVERVWGYEGEGNRDLVRGLVRRVRRKLEPEGDKHQFIHNLPGVGYRFSSE